MSTARKILIVDDDEDLRSSLQDQLALHDEFDVTTAGTASKGIERARAEHHDLVVFDVGLPDMDGREAVKLLRKSGFKSPIIMLTANDRTPTRSSGSMPAPTTTSPSPSSSLSLARIRAQLRQHEQSEDAVFAIGHYVQARVQAAGRRARRQDPPHRGDLDPEVPLPRRGRW